MGNRPDGLIVSQAGHQTAIHYFKDTSFVLDGSIGGLIENPPHVAVALRGAVVGVHSRALFFSRACAHPGGEILGRSKSGCLGTHFGNDLLSLYSKTCT